MKVDEDRLDAIEGRARLASEGPWKERIATGTADRLLSSPSTKRGVCVIPYRYGTAESRARDSVFVRNARADVPDLVADLREARAVLESLEWVPSEEAAGEWCLRCSGPKPNHRPDCAVAAVLGRKPA